MSLRLQVPWLCNQVSGPKTFWTRQTGLPVHMEVPFLTPHLDKNHGCLLVAAYSWRTSFLCVWDGNRLLLCWHSYWPPPCWSRDICINAFDGFICVQFPTRYPRHRPCRYKTTLMVIFYEYLRENYRVVMAPHRSINHWWGFHVGIFFYFNYTYKKELTRSRRENTLT